MPKHADRQNKMNNNVLCAINLEQLLQRYNQRYAFIKKLLNLLINEHPKKLEELENIESTCDFDALRVFAHSLKGMSGNICAEGLQQLSSQVEQYAKSRDKQAFVLVTQLRQQLMALKNDADRIAGELDG